MQFRQKRSGSEDLYLTDTQVVALKGRRLRIKCVNGAIWITGKPGSEHILESGEAAEIDDRGKICIQAFRPSAIQIQGKFRWNAAVKKHNNRYRPPLPGLPSWGIR